MKFYYPPMELSEPVPPVQYFWRCAHHTSAMENFFEKRATCEWGCHAEELKQYHSGVHPLPASWGTPRDNVVRAFR